MPAIITPDSVRHGVQVVCRKVVKENKSDTTYLCSFSLILFQRARHHANNVLNEHDTVQLMWDRRLKLLPFHDDDSEPVTRRGRGRNADADEMTWTVDDLLRCTTKVVPVQRVGESEAAGKKRAAEKEAERAAVARAFFGVTGTSGSLSLFA